MERALRLAVGLTLALVVGAALSAAAEKVTLVFDGRYSPTAGNQNMAYKAFAQAIKEYESLNPDVNVEYIGTGDTKGYLQQILTHAAAGELPDIVNLYDAWMPDFAYRDWLLAPPSWLVHEMRQQIFPAALFSTTYRGRILGMPTENQVQALLYSKPALAAAGIAVPQTWDQLDAASKRLTRVENGKITQYGLSFNGGDWGFTGNFLAQTLADGGTYIDADGNATFADDAGYNVVRRWVRWMHDSPVFGGGFPATTAMAIGYPWWLPSIRSRLLPGTSLDDSVGVAPVPQGRVKRAAHHYGWGLYVFKGSKHPQEAWRFIEFLSMRRPGTSITPLGQAMAAIGSLPDNKADIRSGPFQKDLAFYTGFSANLAYAVEEPQWPEGPKRQGILVSNINDAIRGKQTPVEALQNAVRQMQVVLDQYR